MAKLVVLSCEIDGDFDSADNRVVTANVAGHRVELCAKHRVQLLEAVGVSPEHARAYIDAYDRQAGTKGTNPSMAQVLEMLAEGQADGVAGGTTPEVVQEDLVSAPQEAETGDEAAPAKKRR